MLIDKPDLFECVMVRIIFDPLHFNRRVDVAHPIVEHLRANGLREIEFVGDGDMGYGIVGAILIGKIPLISGIPGLRLTVLLDDKSISQGTAAWERMRDEVPPATDLEKFADELTLLCRRHRVGIEGGQIWHFDPQHDDPRDPAADREKWYFVGYDGGLYTEYRPAGVSVEERRKAREAYVSHIAE
jgi:hypothetical protein